VTLWVMGWFLTALAAAEVSKELVSCAVDELRELGSSVLNVSDR
jgi:hypothetical protein